MDRSEAIKILKEANVIDLASGDTKGRQAIDLAIEALQREVDYGQMVVDYTKIVDGEETEIDPVSYEIGYTHGQTAPTVSEDCISRQQAIEALGEEPDIAQDTDEEWAEHDSWVIHRNAIASLPPVTPTEQTIKEIMDFIGGMNMVDEISNEAYAKISAFVDDGTPTERTGEWEHHIDKNGIPWERCSECGDSTLSVDRENINFCPNCGAYMRGDDSE